MWETFRGKEFNLETKECKCTECKEIKSFDDFHKNSRHKLGIKYVCISCSSKRYKKWKEKNLDKAAKYAKAVIEKRKIVIKDKHQKIIINKLGYYTSDWKVTTNKRIYNLKTEEAECSKCGKIKSFNEFFDHKYQPFNKESACKSCTEKQRKKRSRVYYKNNIEKERLRYAGYYKKASKELADSYIIGLFRARKFFNYDSYDIEIERQILISRRIIRKWRKDNNLTIKQFDSLMRSLNVSPRSDR